jgi:hypothetical protein
MAVSCETIAGILGIGYMTYGLVRYVHDITLTPIEDIFLGCVLLVLAISISGLFRLLGERPCNADTSEGYEA